MEKQKLSVKSSLAYKQAVAYMKDFVASLESGKIVVQNGEEHVTLVPLENVEIKVEAKAKDNKQKFSFEISWCEPVAADLKISDREPEVPVPAAAEAQPEEKAEAPAVPEKQEKKDEKKAEKKALKKEKKAAKKSKGEKAKSEAGKKTR